MGKRRSRGRGESPSSDSSSSDDETPHRRKTSSSARKKRHKDRRDHRRAHHQHDRYQDDRVSADEASSPSSSDSRRHRRRRKRREDRKDKKRDKKKRTRNEERDRARPKHGSTTADSAFDRRNAAIADGLLKLLSDRPAFSSELPIILIRLAGGTTFDLSQMTDEVAARGLAGVFASLESFGVRQEASTRCWMWESPQPPAGASKSSNDLLLLRVVRGVLDQVGLTTQAVDAFEDRLCQKPVAPALPAAAASLQEKINTLPVQRLVTSLLLQHGPNHQLPSELAGLCTMILEGESISLDGLPDEQLRTSLERLFEACGLEKSEMEPDEDGGDGETTVLGYALPDADGHASRTRLVAMLSVCQDRSKNSRRLVQGPLMDPSAYAADPPRMESSSDDEGPAPKGVTRKAPSLTTEQLKAQTARRAIELECAKAGIAPPPVALGDEVGGREEWMLVPGKFDFLGSIKAGQPMKSRTFEGKPSNRGTALDEEKPMDPSIKAEIDEIMNAHEQARGPSLMEAHLQKKAEESKQSSGKKASWKWSRDKDLDSGRNVDKNALNMILGGASSDLKSKFQGGFG